MSVKHLYPLALAAIMACANTGGQSSTSHASAPRRADYLTSDEIGAAKADIANTYDALSRLRPNWLAAHGATSFNPSGNEYASVFVDGQPYGDINSLRNIEASIVADVHYYDVTQAGARFGLRGGPGGVIEVRIKIRDR